MSIYKPASQPDKRRPMKLMDQHGREWFATIELATGDPTGPVDPRFKAPILPPPAYIKVDSRKEYGRVDIDYDGWAQMLRSAHEHWRRELTQNANRMYGDAAAEKIESPPPPLIDVVGRAPEAVEPVLAAQHGDPWILGLTDERPGWADLFFPLIEKKATDLPDELAFLQHGAEPEVEYPIDNGSGWWTLSDGEKIRGNREKAEGAQAALLAAASWGDD